MQLSFISNFAKRATKNIDEIVTELRISPATARNWIKSGLLEQVSSKEVTLTSYEDLKNGVLGSSKLNGRANKLHHVSSQANARTDCENKYGWDYLVSLDNESLELVATNYELGLTSAYKNEHGIFYTPLSVADEMLRSVDFDPKARSFLDPCCGTGNFLVSAIKSGFESKWVFGSDIDPIAALIAKARVYKLTGIVNEQIKAKDFFDYFAEKSTDEIFDCIFTNPPWGKKLSARVKADQSRAFGFKRGMDSSAIFTSGCLSLLKSGGTLGLLLPESFFNIASFEEIREKLLNFEIVSICDHGQAFEGLITKAQSIVVKNLKSDIETKIICRIGPDSDLRRQCEFKENPNSIFNFYTRSADAKTIDHIFSHPHQTLKDKACWALGIVTGNNSKFLLNEPVDGSIPIYKGSDITDYGIKEANNWILDDFSQFQQVAPMEYYMAKEKIAYKFISKKPRFAYDNQKRIFLNSANIIIPKTNFGVNTEDLTFLLNLKIISWLFGRIFNTHKILRSDLEVVPIFSEQLKLSDGRVETDIYEQLGIEELCDGTFKIKS